MGPRWKATAPGHAPKRAPHHAHPSLCQDYRAFEGRGTGLTTPKVSVDGFEDATAAKLLLKEAGDAYRAAYLPKRPRTG